MQQQVKNNPISAAGCKQSDSDRVFLCETVYCKETYLLKFTESDGSPEVMMSNNKYSQLSKITSESICNVDNGKIVVNMKK